MVGVAVRPTGSPAVRKGRVGDAGRIPACMDARFSERSIWDGACSESAPARGVAGKHSLPPPVLRCSGLHKGVVSDVPGADCGLCEDGREGSLVLCKEREFVTKAVWARHLTLPGASCGLRATCGPRGRGRRPTWLPRRRAPNGGTSRWSVASASKHACRRRRMHPACGDTHACGPLPRT
jgi:hypothetical protein